MHQKTIERFLKKVKKTKTCWLWLANKNQKGYGLFSIKDKCFSAHRISWRIFRGSIPKNKHVLHGCDISGCVNPKHLWIGTNKENAIDRWKKGRTNWQLYGRPSKKGENHPQAILNWKKVRWIRKMFNSGKLRQFEMAKKFKVKHRTINSIVHNINWIEKGQKREEETKK